MKKHLFLIIYSAVVVLAIAAIVVALVMAGKEIDRYDDALPEHIADRVLEDFKNGKANITYPNVTTSKYDAVGDNAFSAYKEKLSNVKEWSYKVNSGSTSITNMVYGIFGDDELVAYLKLVCTDSETVLNLLTVNDWKIDCVTPVLQMATYTLTVDVPSGYTAKVNGLDVTDSEEVSVSEKNGNTIYEIEDILVIPEVEVFDRTGNKCNATEKDGYVSVDNVTYYSLILPAGIKVSDQGIIITGKENEDAPGTIKYMFGTTSDSIELTDVLGQRIKYCKNDELIFRDAAVVIPDNYTISFGNADMQSFVTEKTANKLYKYVLELNDTVTAGSVKMPENVRYSFTDLLALPEFEIKDNLGNECSYTYGENEIVIETQVAVKGLPAEFSDLNASYIAYIWSQYSQCNLGSGRSAFDKVAQYLIKDSYLYNAAYMSYKNGQLGAVSSHSTKTIEKTVTSTIVFAEDLVACKVHIVKHHYLPGTGKIPPHVSEEITNDTYYFYKLDGEWKLVDVLVSEDYSYTEIPTDTE